MDQLAFFPHPDPPPLSGKLPLRERPAGRLAYLGPGALACHELLALIIGGKNGLELGAQLLQQYGTLAAMSKAPLIELQRTKGIGPQAAGRLQAALQLAIRLAGEPPESKPQIRSPHDAAHLLMAEMATLEQETLRVILMDARNRVLDIPTIYVGSLHSCVVRTAEIIRPAIRANAASIIIAHNHPSGDPTPSPEDIHMTSAINQSCKLMDIELMDSLIIGQGRFISLKERDLGFT